MTWTIIGLMVALVSYVAYRWWKQRSGGEAVNNAVNNAVNGAVNGAVNDAVNGAVNGAVDGAVNGAVGAVTAGPPMLRP